MAILLQNAVLADLDPPKLEKAQLRVKEGKIVARGKTLEKEKGDEVVDCEGALVLPGLVNGHTHLYFALSAGMPAAQNPPHQFSEYLQSVWWRFDRAQNENSIAKAARVAALDAIRCGTTTVIDHHSSPPVIDGSLDIIEEALRETGLRGVLSYQASDRNSSGEAKEGMAENRRYLEKCREHGEGQFAGLAGADSSFTCTDDTLWELSEMALDFDTGVHMQVAESHCDQVLTTRHFDLFVVERLEKFSLLRPKSIFAHGAHLHKDAQECLHEACVTLAHTPRSNMNFGIGRTPVEGFHCPVMLGTNGLGEDIFAEAKTAWLRARDSHAALEPGQIIEMLAAGARYASNLLSREIGKLYTGAEADLLVTSYRPAVPLSAENFASHLLYSMGPEYVRHVMAGGKWLMRNHVIESCDEKKIRSDSVSIARRLWDRMEKIE